MILNRLFKNSIRTTTTQQRGYPGAAALNILKRRQKTVQQIGKITGTLKVVAQSRLGPAQERADKVAPFFLSMDKLFKPVTEKIKENSSDLNIVTIVVYTDRGLCGPCNNGINRMLDKESLSNQTVVIWGEKGSAGFDKSKHKGKVVVSAHPNLKSPISYLEISSYVAKILKYDCDGYRLIFNKMSGPNNSDIQQLWLPSLKTLDLESSKDTLVAYEVEAVASDELIQNLNEYHISSAVNYAVCSNLAVELFQRRNSMQNASQNAKEVVGKIKLKYNKARQSMITTELGEIVSGAAAVDAMIKARK